jgi:hypothetical protein
MMTPEQWQDLAVKISRIDTKMAILVSDDLSKGIVPEMKGILNKHEAQISFWRGAIALAGFFILAFGAILWSHIAGGH